MFIISILLPFVIFGLWTLLIYQFPPGEIVEYFGTQNGYTAVLVLSFIGGISIIIPIPYHLVLMTFAAGGMNPVLLGIVATIGQATGDSTSYLLGYSGGKVVQHALFSVVERFQRWCMSLTYWKFGTVLVIYGAVSPFSNDWLLIPMGIARYPYRKIMVPLEIGNLIFNVGAGFLGAYGLASILG
jgi:membrane protein YqaA with SNARE-associated domain